MDNQKDRLFKPEAAWVSLWLVVVVIAYYQYGLSNLFLNKSYCIALSYRNLPTFIEPKNLMGLFVVLFSVFVVTKAIRHLIKESPLFGKYWQVGVSALFFTVLLLINVGCR